MALWSKNNLACRATWTTLMLLDQSDEVFDKSGDIKVSDFQFFEPGASGPVLTAKAETLAHQMDNIFIHVRGAKYEKGVKTAQAVSGIVQVLIKKDNTMADLAEVNDSNYLFWGEGKP